MGLPSRHRVRDVVGRAFVPRLVNSTPPDLWRVLAALESSGVDRSVIVPIHYYATAVSEPLLWDFVVGELDHVHYRPDVAHSRRRLAPAVPCP